MNKYMIDISNFTKHSFDNFDINLCQKEVDGGEISFEKIDEIRMHPEAKSIIISGLKQDTFEYFVNEYGGQFEAISFWKNKAVKDLSCLGKLTNIKYIHYFFNQKATDLWDMSGNVNLIGLGIYDFGKLHDIGRVETAPGLIYFQIGDAVNATMTVHSLKPIINTGITHFEWWGKSVEDNDYACLSKSKIEELDISPTRFTMEELADLLALFPESLKGSVTKPYVKGGIKDKDGYREYYYLCKHKKVCEKGKDDERFNNYLKEFDRLLYEKRKR